MPAPNVADSARHAERVKSHARVFGAISSPRPAEACVASVPNILFSRCRGKVDGKRQRRQLKPSPRQGKRVLARGMIRNELKLQD